VVETKGFQVVSYKKKGRKPKPGLARGGVMLQEGERTSRVIKEKVKEPPMDYEGGEEVVLATEKEEVDFVQHFVKHTNTTTLWQERE